MLNARDPQGLTCGGVEQPWDDCTRPVGYWDGGTSVGAGGGGSGRFGELTAAAITMESLRQGERGNKAALCVYAQDTGSLLCWDNRTGNNVVQTSGYSGKGDARNNPAMQFAANRGPIPQGSWTISPATRATKGPFTTPLFPTSDTFTSGRDNFLFHGDNQYGNYSASEGCIVVGRAARQVIHSLGGGILYVVSSFGLVP